VDSEIDKRLEAIGSDEALALRGKAAIANARLAYALYEEEFSSERFAALEAKGANRQRPLWASTGVKNPDYSDTMYITELVVPNTVNTMPEKTMMAFADHGEVRGDMVTGTKAEAQQVLDDLERVGISYDDVVDVLEKEGVEKFEASWNELVVDVKQELDAAKAAR
jgi:transaldolase